MSKTYEITTITDFLKVPADARERCLAEFGDALDVLEFVFGEQAAVSFQMPFVWTDDGINKASFDLKYPDGSTETLVVTHEETRNAV